MKNLLKIFLLTVALNVWSQDDTILDVPRVDERIELISIAFRLAEAWEYSSKEYPDYVNGIEKHYGQFKDHALIQYIKLIREEKGIGYDAVMSFAINITEPPKMKPLKPFSDEVPDPRWGPEASHQFLSLLNAFYLDTNSDLFFKQQADIYQVATGRFEKIHNDINLDWYSQFYGESPKGEFKTVIAVGIGDKGYGPKTTLANGDEVIYAVIGVAQLDSNGRPVFDKDYFFPTLLHEFNHSFVNHLIAQHEEALAKSGQLLYAQLEKTMNEQGYYSWETMYAEALVRASVVKYMMDNDFEEQLIQKEINEQVEAGFVWTDALVKALVRFDSEREKYPRLNDFMPELADFLNRVAQDSKPIKPGVNTSK